MKGLIEKIKEKKNLSRNEAYTAITNILEDASDDEIYDFLIAMNEKEATVDELVGFANGMKSEAISIRPNVKMLVDTCGTGGDCKGTINISTGAAIITASAGISVAKHGNYSVSSKSGSAEVLESLGFNINLEPEYCKKMIEETNFGFLLAPRFHPAMKRVAPIRKKIGKRTIFNLLGPLCNPANPQAQLIGVYDKKLCEKFCYALEELGLERALVVYGSGLDEISNTDETIVYELNNGKIKNYKIKPENFGFKRYQLEDISGISPEENAKELRDILNGKKGAKRDIIVLNAGAGIYLGRGAVSLERGIKKAGHLLDSGNSSRKLPEIIEYSKDF